MAAEEPKYVVLEQRDGYELRQYEPYLVAQTEVTGSQRSGGNQAFRVLAGYIFGNNRQQEKMAMTIPVTSQRNASASSGGETVYQWQFVMERKYDRDQLPTPVDRRVNIREIPARVMAAGKYAGNTGEKNFRENLTKLSAAIERDGLRAVGEPISAVYNGPFTPGFLRRNEVLVEIDNQPPPSGS